MVGRRLLRNLVPPYGCPAKYNRVMDRFITRKRHSLALLAVFLLGMLSAYALGADQPKETLDALRSQGHYDEAIDFLQHARTNPGTPKAFAQTIDYELAVTRIDAAAGLPEAQRDQPLQLAQESLTKFLADQPQHARAAEARCQLGSVLLDRGRLQRVLADEHEGAERQKYLEAARGLLHQAEQQWAGIDKAGDEELKQIIPRRGEDIKQTQARDAIRRRQLQARLARAWVQYEMGQTFPAGSSERTAALQEAGNRFDAIYDPQLQRLADFYARLGRGMCCKDLGESEKAFNIFEEVLGGVPDEPADFHTLRGKAAVQALETALRPELKKYKPALDIARAWLAGDRSQTAAGEAGPALGEVDLAIRYFGGEAATAYLKTLPPAAPSKATCGNGRSTGRGGSSISWLLRPDPTRRKPKSAGSMLRSALRRRTSRGHLPTPATMPRRPWTASSPPWRIRKRPSGKKRPSPPPPASIAIRNASDRNRSPSRKPRP